MNLSATTPRAPNGWMDNRNADLALVLGTVFLATLAAAFAGLSPEYLALVVMADLWLLGYHHVIATFTKLAGTASDRQRNATLIWILLPAVLVATFLVGRFAGVVIIVSIYFFWQWFHYVRQSWGIAQRFRYRAGGQNWRHPVLSELAFWSVPVWGLLKRCHQNPDIFLWLPIWLPPVPLMAVEFAGAISALLVAWWIFSRWQAWRDGQTALGYDLYAATHFVIFACAYIYIEDVTLGWLLINIWHNAQYLLFVRMHNRQRFFGGISNEGPVLSWLSQRGFVRAIIYFGVCLAVSTVLYRIIEIGAAQLADDSNFLGGSAAGAALTLTILIAMTLNFHHYIVDSIVWKRKHSQPKQ